MPSWLKSLSFPFNFWNVSRSHEVEFKNFSIIKRVFVRFSSGQVQVKVSELKVIPSTVPFVEGPNAFFEFVAIFCRFDIDFFAY